MNSSDARITVEVLRTVSELEQIRDFWTSLATNRDGDLDHYLFTIGSRSEVIRPHVIVLYRDRVPHKLLIGRLEEEKLPIRIGYIRLHTGKVRSLTFIEGGTLRDIFAAEGDLFIASIMDSLRAGEADVAALHGVGVDHPLYERALSSPGFFCADHFPATQVHWVRRPQAASDSFLATLSSNERYNHRRRAKKLLKDFPGKIRIDCFHDGSDIRRLMDDAETVAKTSYQRGLGVGFVNDQTMRDRLELDASKGTLRGHILYVDGQPCSFWIGSLYRGIFYNDFMAYNPDYAKYAPGMYLAVSVMEEMRQEAGADATPGIDFGYGEADWKARFGDHCGQESSVHIWAPTGKGIGTNALITAMAAVDHSAKAVLRRTGLFAKIKRHWRSRISQKARGKGDSPATAV